MWAVGPWDSLWLGQGAPPSVRLSPSFLLVPRRCQPSPGLNALTPPAPLDASQVDSFNKSHMLLLPWCVLLEGPVLNINAVII